jgi:SAM-dependent methyltransferase
MKKHTDHSFRRNPFKHAILKNKAGIIPILLWLLIAYPIADANAQDLDVPFASTPPNVVERMLEVANVGPGDYVIDLGCGDGRIVIAAAKRGAFGHGVDLDPKRIREARDNAQKSNVSEKVMFLEEDIFKTEISRASVVTMYLLSTVNEDLRPRLLEELEPGTRIVSHNFGMGMWEPDEHLILGDSYMDKDNLTIDQQLEVLDHEIFLWIVPAQIEGRWNWQTNGKKFTLQVEQNFQKFHASLRSGKDSLIISNKVLKGKKLSFTASNPQDGSQYAFSGKVEGDRITGNVQIRNQNNHILRKWEAELSNHP